jgi:NADH:ubiquinone oxidoreductase subunit 3 (subunit A)
MTFEFSYLFNYYILLYYLIFSLLISFVLVVVSILVRFLLLTKPDQELISVYECGFLPFDRVRNKFDVQFFMVGLLFVLFDLEVVFILPWGLFLFYMSLFVFYVMVFFLVILVIAFCFELVNEALVF